MKDLSMPWDALYTRFLLKDIFGKMVPGAGLVMVTGIAITTPERVGELARQMPIASWALAAGFFWIVGLGIQGIGEWINVVHMFPHIGRGTRSEVEQNWILARRDFERQANDRERHNADRAAVLMEAAGNGALTSGVAAVILLLDSVWDLSFGQMVSAWISLTVLALALFAMHTLQKQRLQATVKAASAELIPASPATVEVEDLARENKPQPQLYQALLGLYIHIDNLIWARVRDLGFVQSAVIGASIALWSVPAAWLIPFGGAVMTLLLHAFTKRFIQDRDLNLDLLDKLACEAAAGIAQHFTSYMQHKHADGIASPVRLRGTTRGRNTALLTDVMLFFAYIVDGGLVFALLSDEFIAFPSWAQALLAALGLVCFAPFLRDLHERCWPERRFQTRRGQEQPDAGPPAAPAAS